MTRTLFVTASKDGEFTSNELNSLADEIIEVVPDDTNVLVCDSRVEFMDEEQVKELVSSLIEALPESE